MLRQSILETDGVREELAFHQGGTGGRNFELLVVASCCSVGRNELIVRDVNQLVGNVVHHGNSGNLSTELKRVLTQILEHGGDAALPGIVIHYIPCCTPLNGFDLVDTLLGRWRPNNWHTVLLAAQRCCNRGL